MRIVKAMVLLLAAAVPSACASEQEDYCDTVGAHRKELGEIAKSGDPARALDVLPAYRDLRDRAPDDIADDWGVVVDALEGLQDALEDAGTDMSYDPEDPPPDVSSADRLAIERAADELGSDRTLDAMASVEQHALDVCKTPLS